MLVAPRPNSIPVSPRLSLRPQKPLVRVCLFQMPQRVPSPTACSPAPRQIPVKARNAAMDAVTLFLLIFNCSWYRSDSSDDAHKNSSSVLPSQEDNPAKPRVRYPFRAYLLWSLLLYPKLRCWEKISRIFDVKSSMLDSKCRLKSANRM